MRGQRILKVEDIARGISANFLLYVDRMIKEVQGRVDSKNLQHCHISVDQLYSAMRTSECRKLLVGFAVSGMY